MEVKPTSPNNYSAHNGSTNSGHSQKSDNEYSTDDNRGLTIDDLPEEMLLSVFEKLDTFHLILVVPQVCTRWASLVFSHSPSMERVPGLVVEYTKHKTLLRLVSIGLLQDRIVSIFLRHDDSSEVLGLASLVNCSPYVNLMQYEPFPYSFLVGRLRKLVMRYWRYNVDWPVPMVSSMVNLDTLLLYEVRLDPCDYTGLYELGNACPRLQNVSFVQCNISKSFELEHLHIGFRWLQCFRLQHHPVNARFLDDLLGMHLDSGLRMVVFDIVKDPLNEGDRVLDVLEDRLRGRSVIKIVHNNWPYVEENRFRRFMDTNIMRNADVIICITYNHYALTFDPKMSIKWAGVETDAD